MSKYFLILIIVLSACTAGLVKPEVDLVNLNISDVTVFRTGMDVSVQVDNENEYPITLKNSVHRLYLNDIYLGKGFSNEQVTIPPFSRSVIDVDLQLSNFALGRVVNDLMNSDNLNYKLQSKLYLDGNFFFNSYSVEKSGVISDLKNFRKVQ